MREKPYKPPLHKLARKAINRRIGELRDRIRRASPPWLRRRFAPVYDSLDALLVDHGVFRLFYLNHYHIGGDAWRSAQPWPHQIRRIVRKRGVRTIVNLRGARDDCGEYRLEKRTCKKLGVTLNDDIRVYSRAAPKRETIRSIRDSFEQLQGPILIHCKSGADRAGLVAVLYLHFVENVPIEQARRQLSLRYGHIKQAKTGVLDYFFERYLAYAKDHDISFIDWVETVYDEHSLKQQFRSRSWANTLVDGILDRE